MSDTTIDVKHSSVWNFALLSSHPISRVAIVRSYMLRIYIVPPKRPPSYILNLAYPSFVPQSLLYRISSLPHEGLVIVSTILRPRS